MAPNLSRREFLKLAAVGTGAALLPPSARAAYAVARSTVTAEAAHPAIDVNVNVGQWPARRLLLDEPKRLVAKLRSRGVAQAWTGSLEGLLQKEVGGVNERLAGICRLHGRGLLLPFGCINPNLPGWERDFQQCVQVHRFKGIRLHPNYHGYRLEDPCFARLLSMAAEHRLIVQLAVVMEDERMMHPLLRVEPVDLAPLAELVRHTAGVHLMLLNALRTVRGKSLQTLISAGDISVEISMLEGVGGLADLLEQVPCSRILFGSHTPLFYFEAAALKLRESALSSEQERQIRLVNAQAILRPLQSREKTAHG